MWSPRKQDNIVSIVGATNYDECMAVAGKQKSTLHLKKEKTRFITSTIMGVWWKWILPELRFEHKNGRVEKVKTDFLQKMPPM